MISIGNLSTEDVTWGGLTFQPAEVRIIRDSDVEAVKADVALNTALITRQASLYLNGALVEGELQALRELMLYSV